MKLFEFINEQRKKSFGYLCLSALIYSILILIPVLFFANVKLFPAITEYFSSDYDKEYGCYIEDYKLSCNEDYYSFNNNELVIDLNYDGDGSNVVGDGILLTSDTIYSHGGSITYGELLQTMGHDSDDIFKSDVLKFVNNVGPSLFIFIYVSVVIGAYAGYFALASFWALVMKYLCDWILKIKITYQESFKIFGYIIVVYALLNAITSVVASFTVRGLIIQYLNFIPFIGFIFSSAVYLGLYYLVLKSDSKEEKGIEVLE